jgi:flavodoxin
MKVMLIYFSFSGNTEKLAGIIGETLEEQGSVTDYVKLETIRKSSFFEKCINSFKKRSEEIIEVPSVVDSEFIFLGSPVWAFDIAPAVRKFIEETDFSGKSVYLFMTYGSGSGKSRAIESFRKLIERKGGQVKGILEIKGKKIKEDNETLRKKIREFLPPVKR